MEPQTQSSSRGVIIGIIIVIIILVIVGLVWANSNRDMVSDTNTDTNSVLPISDNTDTSASVGTTTTSTAPMTANVTYNGVNFSPTSVEIRQGGTVTFVNTSSGQMWVASGPHPTHTIYPEFDQKAAVGNGGMYSFTFEKAGEWKYHNHRNPSAFGTVVVK